MSSIPTKQIDGDVAVGRNVSAGGKATVRGSATIDHNLIVKGWLDAPNIKGPNKGLFESVTKLREGYPTPHEGWYALVGDSLPAPLYISDGGEWVATGKSAGTPTIDCQQYNDAVEALEGDIALLSNDITDIEQSIEKICTDITTLSDEVNSIKEVISGHTTELQNLSEAQTEQNTTISQLETATATAQSTADTARSEAAAAQETADAAKEVTDTKDMPGGLASLDDDGFVPQYQLPDAVRNAVEFSGILQLFSIPEVETASASSGDIFFIPRTGTFLCRATTPEGMKYYYNWAGADAFGSITETGRKPALGKFYIDKSQDRQYFYDGSELVAVSADIAKRLALTQPVRCADEAELETKAASAEAGQQFYIPEED